LGGYSYINPLLSCDINEDTPDPNYSSLQQELAAHINAAKARGDITRASVYVRDMNSGNWTGVNVNDLFIPASLLKVPLMIAYLRESEEQRGLLDTSYTLSSKDNNAGEYFKPAQPLELGGTYTINQLLAAMIVQSDNNAEEVLNDHVSTTTLNDVYNNFGIPAAADGSVADMSTSEYMRLFRILYNATYLHRTDSQTALKWLADSDFPQGAVHGLPAGTIFSNKFGERTLLNADGSVQKRDLADCGIVYYPQAPYGVCVMTEGNDFDALANVIADLSKTVYAAVDSQVLSR